MTLGCSMRNDKLEKMILLCQSGELTDLQTQELNKALSSYPDARAYRDSLKLVVDQARESLPAGNPSPGVIRAIRAAGEAHVAKRRTILFPPVLIQGFAYAALLAIVIGGWFLFVRDDRSDRILEIQVLIDAAADVEELLPQDAVPSDKEDPELLALARQLLLMEGLDFDDDVSIDYPDEAITTDVVPSPTVFRGRSIGAHRARKYV